ncbi:hypothetical protein RhiXN_05663 [Rhizoctonia solani]|uniref:Uncharacterized protein n=1 Tax=Rhizoctonia solani TaxID=456999 RepID=A0A8H8NVI0_9AGAM|nr:uncharacterized protein RhiXN_05663 [Rhizoctonia solani]QRW20674.1 hypothetical protein RhiXN_05663 [Rhizoctonia solani]
MAAPGYSSSENSAPAYSASASDGEHVLEFQSPLVARPVNLPDRYVFQSQRIKLDLGARVWPTDTPCFGYTGTVKGVVSVASLEHVKSVVVVVEGVVTTSYMERGVLAGHSESILFQRSTTLYKKGPILPDLESGLDYPFSIGFPTTCDGRIDPLPPSFKYSFPGVLLKIQYHVRVEMPRSGLRRWENIMVPILYLPRSHAHTSLQELPLYTDRVDPSVMTPTQGMKEIDLPPRSANKTSKHSKPLSTGVQAKIALPFPLIVASGDPIPFVITIHSQSQAIAVLYTNITLQLFKVTTTQVPQGTLSKEEVLASGNAYDLEQPGNGVQVLRGELGSGVLGAEHSWSVGEMIQIKVNPASK